MTNTESLQPLPICRAICYPRRVHWHMPAALRKSAPESDQHCIIVAVPKTQKSRNAHVNQKIPFANPPGVVASFVVAKVY